MPGSFSLRTSIRGKSAPHSPVFKGRNLALRRVDDPQIRSRRALAVALLQIRIGQEQLARSADPGTLSCGLRKREATYLCLLFMAPGITGRMRATRDGIPELSQ